MKYVCQVLAEIVRFTQKQGLKGSEGGWKDFLHGNDTASCAVYDPTRKSKDVLVTFLQTFQEIDQKVTSAEGFTLIWMNYLSFHSFDGFVLSWFQFFRKIIKRSAEYKALEKFISDFPDQEYPQQVYVVWSSDIG